MRSNGRLKFTHAWYASSFSGSYANARTFGLLEISVKVQSGDFYVWSILFSVSQPVANRVQGKPEHSEGDLSPRSRLEIQKTRSC